MGRIKTTDATMKFKLTFAQLEKLKNAARENGVKIAAILRQQIDSL
jgi:hypothetical protein